MFPAARLTDMTATGDVITGPGAPTVLIENLPAACIGDLVSGSVCVGAIAQGSATVLIAGRPAARVTSVVNGVNPITGVPVSTTIIKGAMKTMIGG
ncbi:MAG TPA: PAAR domain-containing protein [Anaerolineaceae bacterium]|nr:PAAR domain-containing protein [Anaerolineaceae bacterium]